MVRGIKAESRRPPAGRPGPQPHARAIAPALHGRAVGPWKGTFASLTITAACAPGPLRVQPPDPPSPSWCPRLKHPQRSFKQVSRQQWPTPAAMDAHGLPPGHGWASPLPPSAHRARLAAPARPPPIEPGRRRPPRTPRPAPPHSSRARADAARPRPRRPTASSARRPAPRHPGSGPPWAGAGVSGRGTPQPLRPGGSTTRSSCRPARVRRAHGHVQGGRRKPRR